MTRTKAPHALLLTIFASCLLISEAIANPLPFPVKIDGHSATVKSKVISTIAPPVSADASIEITADTQMVIINIFASDAHGNVANGVQPAIIILQGTTKGKLSKTMNNKKLSTGTYLANVVIAEKGTSRVVFSVK